MEPAVRTGRKTLFPSLLYSLKITRPLFQHLDRENKQPWEMLNKARKQIEITCSACQGRINFARRTSKNKLLTLQQVSERLPRYNEAPFGLRPLCCAAIEYE